ncbi:TonB-dependent receptor [soil metagenome]
MIKIFSIILLVLLNSHFAFSQDITKISGKVVDENNKPLTGANLVIKGTIDGATTDEKGAFDFETDKKGSQSLIITAIDYTENKMDIVLEPGKDLILNIKMKKAEVKTEEILVTASSFTSGENSKVTLTPLEIVRIPGADADLYKAITTFPGSNQVDEGSRITVRGGDPNEVITILDQATLYNPFIFDDTYNTSSYSTVDPWSLKGINFTSGGFSARFGNALSAVLDLRSYSMTRGTGMFAVLGIGSGALAGVYTSNSGKWGGTFSVNQSYLKPFFDLNGISADYSKVPEAKGAGGTLSYKFSEGSYLKLYANYTGDKIGIRNTSPSFDGFFNSKSDQIFTNAKLSLAPSTTSSLNAGLSFSSYVRKLDYGVLNTEDKSIYSKFRTDFTQQVNNKIDINAGAEYEYNQSTISGIVPAFSFNLNTNAASYNIDTSISSGRIGSYVEAQMKLSDKFFVIPGIRSDYHTLSKKISFDPRLSMGYQVSKYNVLRGTVGVYHQYASLRSFEGTFNNDLDPEQAIHYILGYEFNKDGDIVARIEGYYKDYSNLVIFDKNTGYNQSAGKGFAKGIDVFIKGKYKNKLTGWISYAYSDSKRRQFDALSETSANYDITHNLSVVASYNITDNITVGAIFKTSTGKPYTPVLSSSFVPSQNVYAPLYGEVNSDRFPTYNRVDMNFQYLTSVFNKFTVLFVAFNNVLNTENLYQYNYNSDYSQKIPIRTNNKRLVYFGIGIQI